MKGALYSAVNLHEQGDEAPLRGIADASSADPVKQIAAILLACLQGDAVPALAVLDSPYLAALCLTWVTFRPHPDVLWACSADHLDKTDAVLRALCEAAEQAPYPIGSRG